MEYLIGGYFDITGHKITEINKRAFLYEKKDGKGNVGWNTAASVNFEASLPNFLPSWIR